MAGGFLGRPAVAWGCDRTNIAQSGVLYAAEHAWIQLVQIFGGRHHSGQLIQVAIIDQLE